MRTFTIFKTTFLSALLLFLFTMTSFAQNCSLFEDFENMNGNAAYTGKTITTLTGDWWIVGYSTMDADDRRMDSKSIRLRANAKDTLNLVSGAGTGANVVEMLFDKPNGIGTVSFYYGSYSTNSGGKLFVEYSIDGGGTWISPGNNSITAESWANAGSVMKMFSVPINIEGKARIRILKKNQSGSTSVNVDNITITNYVPEGQVYAPGFTPAEGTYTPPFAVTITSCTPDATIRYTLNGSDPDEDSNVYENPIPISVETTIKAKAWKAGMEPSAISTAIYTFPPVISTLAQLRALAPAYIQGTNTGTTVYEFIGEAVITHMQDFNNTKYIQDETAAIVIHDPAPGKISGFYEGDKITKLTGTLTNYWGMVRIVPLKNCELVSWNNKVPATVITASQLDFDNNSPHQAKVVQIDDVFYTAASGNLGNFGSGKYYNLKENNVVYDSVVYTEKYEATYISQPIPTYAVNITGIFIFKGTTGVVTKNRIVPMDKLQAVLKITDYNQSAIQLAPNPAVNFVNIVTGSAMKMEVYSLLGTLITTETLSEGSNIISVSNYVPGVYIIKLIDAGTGQSFVQKLVVQ